MDSEFQRLIKLLSRLPGLGPRSGRRVALYLMKNPDKILSPLIRSLQTVRDVMGFCFECGHLDEQDPCYICKDSSRDSTMLCVVADVADVWALERAGSYLGKYHVLGGVLSGLDGVGPEDLRVKSLLNRCKNPLLSEVILALNTTVDGQTTAHYVMDLLRAFSHIKITALACGVPLGGELDYLDEGTLATALVARRQA